MGAGEWGFEGTKKKSVTSPLASTGADVELSSARRLRKDKSMKIIAKGAIRLLLLIAFIALCIALAAILEITPSPPVCEPQPLRQMPC